MFSGSSLVPRQVTSQIDFNNKAWQENRKRGGLQWTGGDKTHHNDGGPCPLESCHNRTILNMVNNSFFPSSVIFPLFWLIHSLHLGRACICFLNFQYYAFPFLISSWPGSFHLIARSFTHNSYWLLSSYESNLFIYQLGLHSEYFLLYDEKKTSLCSNTAF